MIPQLWLKAAFKRVAPHIRNTPLTYDPRQDLYLKWENTQVTGSFKVRGAINKVLSLLPEEKSKGLVTASAGNHGQGVALAGKLAGTNVLIFASEHATPTKIQAMQALGAQVRLVQGGYGEAENAGLGFSAKQGTWISPYNDSLVIAGQGTLGLEILEQLPDLPHLTWVVPVGGGGLISGIGAAIKSQPRLGQITHHRLIGVQSESSPFFHQIFNVGSQSGVSELPSLADGLAGPVEANSITISMVSELVDDFILVSELDIAYAIAYAWQEYGQKIEGSAAVALAAVLRGKVSDRPAVVILSGGNIQPEIHAEIVQRVSLESIE
jgi:threonine dehydratase